MNGIHALLLAITLTSSITTSPDSLKDDLLKSALGQAARTAIETKYNENRSWYLNKFEIRYISYDRLSNRFIVEMDVPSCTIQNLYVRGVDHDDLVTFHVGLNTGIRVVKIEKRY